MKLRNNNRGYALLWTVIALMLGTIFVAGALQLASSMTQRSMNQNHRNQAYFTALSVVDTIVAQLGGPLDEGTPNGAAAIATLAKLAKDGDKVRVTNISGLPDEMGSCAVEITRKGMQLQITATAKSGNDSYELTGLLGGTIVHAPSISGIGRPGLAASSGVGGIVTGGNAGNSSFVTDPNTPIYIWDPNENTVFRSTGSHIMHMSAVYSKGSVTINDNGQKIHVHGEIVCDGNVDITGDVKVGSYKDCCDNTAPSYIYTLGRLSSAHRAQIFGDVTANEVSMKETSSITGNVKTGSVADGSMGSVTLSDGAKIDGKVDTDSLTIEGDKGSGVTGNVRAQTITLSHEAKITGNVEAGDIVMSGTTTIDGNVKADTIVMSYGATIKGKVDANKIIIEGQWNSNSITGNVHSVGVHLRGLSQLNGDVTAGELTMTESCRINGNAVANRAIGDLGVYINGKLTYYETNFDLSPVVQAKSLVQLTERVEVPGVPVMSPSDSLASKTPDAEQPPKIIVPEGVPWLPSVIDGSSGGRARVFSVARDTLLNSLVIKGNEPVLVIVEDGAKLSISEMTPPPDKDKPILFIQLGSGSELALGVNDYSSNTEFYLYVWGEPAENSLVSFGLSAKFFGGINVDKVWQGAGTVTNKEFHWKNPGSLSWMGPLMDGKPPTEPEDPDSPSEDDEIVWELSGYTNR